MSNTSDVSPPVPVVALVGPTAIGKTALSLEIAHRFNCEIISVDSMQVYKFMDIGTAKIQPDEMEGIPHHLIDIVTPDVEYDAAQFVRDASRAIQKIKDKGKLPLLTGGTGLYLKALSHGLFSDLPQDEGLRKSLHEELNKEGAARLHERLFACDPVSAARIHRNDCSRILRGLEIYLLSGKPWSTHLEEHRQQVSPSPFTFLQIALTCDRDLLYRRINSRTLIMLEDGLEKEVVQLLESGYAPELKSMQSIGYRHMLNYLEDTWSFDRMVELLQRDTRRYAKRQYTWFRAIENIEWFEVSQEHAIMERIASWFTQKRTELQRH